MEALAVSKENLMRTEDRREVSLLGSRFLSGYRAARTAGFLLKSRGAEHHSLLGCLVVPADVDQ